MMMMAKSKRASSAGQRVTLMPLQENLRLCPVRFLRRYLLITMDSESEQLFLPLWPGTARTTSQLIASCLRRMITLAYADAEDAPTHNELCLIARIL